jgi:aryl-alcohol dehydrogenase (NADP+)
MFPLLLDQGVGAIPWSPLARGRLTRAWDAQTNRSEKDEFGRSLVSDADKPIVDAVLALAAQRGVAPAQIALAWVLKNPVVTSPIVGATKPEHLSDAVAAVDLELSDDEIATLEAKYQPHGVVGFQ